MPRDLPLLKALRDVDDPVASTKDITKRVDYCQETVRRRLTQLESRGAVARRRIGNAWAWWLTETGREWLDFRE